MTEEEKVETLEEEVEEEVEEAEEVEEKYKPILEGVRKVLLAGVGALSLAQEEIEDFVHKLIERGEIAEKDGRTLIEDIREKRKKQAQKAQKEFDKRIEELLVRLNIPTKADLDELKTKIAELNEKIDQLKE
jgi:poly(hydroxyalkanoate) granule-associated protein